MKKTFILFFTFIILLSFSSCGTKYEKSVALKEADNYQNFKIKETKIKEKDDFSKDGFSLSIQDITYEDVVTRININLENKKEEAIIVATTEFSVNGFMCNDSLHLTMEPASKKNSYIEISNSWFGKMKISTIKDMEFVVRIFDEKGEEILKSGKLKIKTNAPWNYKQKYEKGGFLIHSGNGITVTARELNKNALSGDYELVFFVENKSKKAISIMAENVSVNSKTVKPSFVMTVGAGKKCIDSMAFKSDDLKEIKNIKANFIAFDESLATVIETELIEIPVN